MPNFGLRTPSCVEDETRSNPKDAPDPVRESVERTIEHLTNRSVSPGDLGRLGQAVDKAKEPATRGVFDAIGGGGNRP